MGVQTPYFPALSLVAMPKKHYSGCLSTKQVLRSSAFNWLNTNRDKGLPNSDKDVLSHNKAQAYQHIGASCCLCVLKTETKVSSETLYSVHNT